MEKAIEEVALAGTEQGKVTKAVFGLNTHS